MTRDWDALIDEEYLGLNVRHPRRHRDPDESVDDRREMDRDCEAVEREEWRGVPCE